MAQKVRRKPRPVETPTLPRGTTRRELAKCFDGVGRLFVRGEDYTIFRSLEVEAKRMAAGESMQAEVVAESDEHVYVRFVDAE